MTRDFLILVCGLAGAAAGGELFLRGMVGMARVWRFSGALIGATVAAFATSSPEMSVSVGSAWAGTPEIALGDALGSNVVNVALILGAALLIGPLRCSREAVQRDLVTAALAPLLVCLLAADGRLSRIDGMVMLLAFFSWLAVAVRRALHQRDEAPPVEGARHWTSLGLVAAGLLLLVLASWLIVKGAGGVARALGWTPFVIGAVVVAVGTSTPEIVTTLFARWRGQDDIGLGTILGSNIFNLLFVVAIAAIIHPITVAGRGPWTTLGLGLVAVGIVVPGRDGMLGRSRGLLLLAGYAAYLGVTLLVR